MKRSFILAKVSLDNGEMLGRMIGVLLLPTLILLKQGDLPHSLLCFAVVGTLELAVLYVPNIYVLTAKGIHPLCSLGYERTWEWEKLKVVGVIHHDSQHMIAFFSEITIEKMEKELGRRQRNIPARTEQEIIIEYFSGKKKKMNMGILSFPARSHHISVIQSYFPQAIELGVSTRQHI